MRRFFSYGLAASLLSIGCGESDPPLSKSSPGPQTAAQQAPQQAPPSGAANSKGTENIFPRYPEFQPELANSSHPEHWRHSYLALVANFKSVKGPDGAEAIDFGPFEGLLDSDEIAQELFEAIAKESQNKSGKIDQSKFEAILEKAKPKPAHTLFVWEATFLEMKDYPDGQQGPAFDWPEPPAPLTVSVQASGGNWRQVPKGAKVRFRGGFDLERPYRLQINAELIEIVPATQKS